MTDANDLNDLAKRYIDLWQEHLADLAADGEVAETIARTIELMSGSASAITTFNMQMAEAALKQNPSPGRPQPPESPIDKEFEPDGGHPKTTPDERAEGSPSPGTAPAALAHGDAVLDVDELIGRIAELEKRLGQLESAAARKSRKPATGSKRN